MKTRLNYCKTAEQTIIILINNHYYCSTGLHPPLDGSGLDIDFCTAIFHCIHNGSCLPLKSYFNKEKRMP